MEKHIVHTRIQHLFLSPFAGFLNFIYVNPCIQSVFRALSIYGEDGFVTMHNHDFMKDPHFQSAYKRGIQANGNDLHWKWRVHVGLWAASHAVQLDGDFVECGVNRGFLSSSIMEYLHWNTLGKKFYLFDTFHGLDARLVSQEEKTLGRVQESQNVYPECYEEVKKNFRKYKHVVLVRGSVPSTLPTVPIQKVSYLSIDMNNYTPEIAAAEYFWPKLVSGAIILLDDYAYKGFLPQKKAFDAFARRKGISILSLPTGQGLIIKP